jgi:hypothetical protein
VVQLQLKLKERLSKQEFSKLVARAQEIAAGGARPLFPDSRDRSLQCFFVVDTEDEGAAKKTMSKLRKLKGVEYVSTAASRTMKS